MHDKLKISERKSEDAMTGKARNATKNLMLRTILAALLLSGFAVSALAGTSTKSFDFGAGGDNPTSRSHARTFTPPESVVIQVTVNYRSSGETSVPLVVEV